MGSQIKQCYMSENGIQSTSEGCYLGYSLEFRARLMEMMEETQETKTPQTSRNADDKTIKEVVL